MLTEKQITALHNKSNAQLQTMYKQLKQQTKKQTQKSIVIAKIKTLLEIYNKIRLDLTESKEPIKPLSKPTIGAMHCVDLRQAHQKLRNSLQSKRKDKESIIKCLLEFDKQLNFFVNY